LPNANRPASSASVNERDDAPDASSISTTPAALKPVPAQIRKSRKASANALNDIELIPIDTKSPNSATPTAIATNSTASALVLVMASTAGRIAPASRT